jgi:DNA polymerase-3 subunit delta'
VSSFEVEHQERAFGLVQRALFAERLPHAYIFHGPEGVGKEMLARGLARVLLCHHPVTTESPAGRRQLDACGRCNDCDLSRADSHPDLHLIYRQLIKYHDDPTVRKRKGLDLGVDVVRQFVIDKVGSKPLRGRAKVFIIREADRITAQAQNALLKTLEEPPETTFLILSVSSLDRLLPTTRSRCQLIPFGTLPTDFIAAKLTELVPDLTVERARRIARFSQGSLGLAVQHAEDGLDECNSRLIDTLAELPQRTVAETVERLAEEAATLGQKYRDRDPEITETEAGRRGLKALLFLAATWYRDVMHVAYESRDLLANVGLNDKLASATAAITPGQAAAAITRLTTAEAELDLNVNTKLCLDNLVIRLSHLAGAA